MRVLFIGNSQMTVCNLPGMIQRMSESAPEDAPRIESSPAAAGGRSLKLHWEAGDTGDTPRALIAQGGWDRVVVQEIYSASREDHETYAALLDDAVRRAGSRTLLFATASVTRHYNAAYRYPESLRALNDMQIEFGRKRGTPVAAAGYAWMRYLGPDPSEGELLDLYDRDKGHPGVKGSYVYACLLYSVITGRSPVGLTHQSTGRDGVTVEPEEAARMQQAAWDEYRQSLAP